MTIDASLLPALVVLGVLCALAAVGITLWRRRIPGAPPRESARTALFLANYAFALEYQGLRRAEITSHVDSLRADLAGVEPHELGAAVERLGSPRTLAAEMTTDMRRPSFVRGSLWAAAAMLAVGAVTILAVEAFLGGFEATATAETVATWSILGFDIGATMGDEGRASAIEFSSVWFFFVPLVAFVVGSRLWRVLGSRERVALTS